MPIPGLQPSPAIIKDFNGPEILAPNLAAAKRPAQKSGNGGLMKRALLTALLTAFGSAGWITAGVLYLGQTPGATGPVTDETAQVLGVKHVDLSRQGRDTDNDQLLDDYEFIFGTNLNDADTDFDTYPDGVEVANGFDPSGSGRPLARLAMAQIGVDAPITFVASRAEADLQAGLQKGVIHYPGTAMPGTVGNTYITGHSSDYVWAAGEYKTALSRLGEVAVNDRINISYKLNNGRQPIFTYQVYDIQVVQVDDPRLFQTEATPVLTLVTSWPVGSTKERLMVKASLVEISQAQ